MLKNRTLLISCLVAPLATMALAGSVQAQTDANEWSVGLGMGGAWSPEYRGADSHETRALPWIQASKGRFSLDPVKGLSYELLAGENWKLAPALSYAEGRNNTGALEDFADVHGSLMAGFLASWTNGPWQLNGDIAGPVTGDLDGVRARGYLRYRGQFTERLRFAVGPGATWGNARWNRALFDVSTSDAASAGLASYHAGGSFVQGSMNGRLTYLLTRQLSVSAVTQYSRLFNDAADSPIVDDVGDANQWLGSLALNYQF